MKNLIKNKNGFSILTVILVIVAVIVVIGVWSLSGQSNTSSSTNSAVDVQAASIVNDAGSIKLVFDKLVINGADPDTVIFMPNIASTVTSPNILDPIDGIQSPKVNVKVIREGASIPHGIWVYRNYFAQAPGVGTPSSITKAIVIAGIKDIVCQRINYNLHGDATLPVRIGGMPSTSHVIDATLDNPNSTTTLGLFGGTLAYTGRISGCVKPTLSAIDDNVYYQLLMIK